MQCQILLHTTSQTDVVSGGAVGRDALSEAHDQPVGAQWHDMSSAQGEMLLSKKSASAVIKVGTICTKDGLDLL